MRFLNKLLTALGILSPNNQLTEFLSAEEVARFIYHKKDWHRPNDHVPARAKPKIFLPMLFNSQWETSVCRISSIDEKRIWMLAHRARQPIPALARADLDTNTIEDANLYTKAAPDNENDYPEHAIIVGWPSTDDGEDTKQKQLEHAVKLAYAAAIATPI